MGWLQKAGITKKKYKNVAKAIGKAVGDAPKRAIQAVANPLQDANVIADSQANALRQTGDVIGDVAGGLASGSTLAAATKDPAMVVKNPSNILVRDQALTETSGYKNVVRPAAKTAAAIGAGALAGPVGTGFASGGVAGGLASAGTLSLEGAVAGVIAGIAGGSLSTTPFQPIESVVNPGIAGFTAGYDSVPQDARGAGTAGHNSVPQDAGGAGTGGFNPNATIPSVETPPTLFDTLSSGANGAYQAYNLYQNYVQPAYEPPPTSDNIAWGEMPSIAAGGLSSPEIIRAMGGVNQQFNNQQAAGGVGNAGAVFGVNPLLTREQVIG